MISYNPGYQSILKNLKESTRQRFVAIELDFPPADIETEVVAHEAGIDAETARALVKLGNAIRNLDGSPLREVASTRMLILAGGLVAEGLNLRSAVQAAIVQVLSDDHDVVRALGELVDAVLSPDVTASDSEGPDRFRFLATFLAGRSVGVAEASARRGCPHERPGHLRLGGSLRRRSSAARCWSRAHSSARGASISGW